MKRILIGECKQETSSFNPQPTAYEDFGILFGDDMLKHHRGVRLETGGALEVFDARSDVQIVPTFSVRAVTSGGPVQSQAFDRMVDEMIASMQRVPEPDGIYLSLHGAMVAENEDDVEGRILLEVRRIFGEKIPIVVSLDLHGILTDRMLELSDAIVIYHTYPHVDFVQTGQRAARLLLKIMDGGVRPVTARVRIPALVRGDELITETGLFGRSIRHAQQLEKSPKGLSAGMFIGNPFTDVFDLASNAVVVMDGAPDAAVREAVQMAKDFWSVREHLHQKLTGLQESVDLALATKGHVVLTDAADATSSGAPGDSNAILRALVEAGCRRTLLAPIVDQPAVRAAFAAGVGKEIDVQLGGSIDPRFQPLALRATVKQLSNGDCPSESDGAIWRAGDSAVLQSGPYTLVVTSRPISLYDRSLFQAHGLNPPDFDMVVVKSPHCQHRFFAAFADRIINVDAPGATSANLPSLGHSRCARPVFPLDDEVDFLACPKIYQRNSA